MSKKRSKKQILTVMIIPILLLSGCGMASELFLEETPTHSLKATLAPTATLKPTPMILSGFIGSIEGIGEHGNMACVTYQGNIQDLDGLTITADISQGNKVLDSSVPLETFDGKDCFEVIDAKYDIGNPVILVLKVDPGSKSIKNYLQEFELGNYVQFPFLKWFYGDSGLGKFDVPNKNHPIAYDFQPVSSEYPDGDGHPVFSPCDGKVIVAQIIPSSVDTHNLWINCSDVGYMVQLGHMDNKKQIGNSVKTGEIVGYLHWEKIIGWPHNHTKAMRIIRFPTPVGYSLEDPYVAQVVDFFYPALQIGGEKKEHGLWLSETLPESVKQMEENGMFNPFYF